VLDLLQVEVNEMFEDSCSGHLNPPGIGLPLVR
jgi:hypothetical protein